MPGRDGRTLEPQRSWAPPGVLVWVASGRNGADAIGMQSDGYTADVERLTLVDMGWDDAACAHSPSAIADYDEGVVTPHASFLALDVARDAALETWQRCAATSRRCMARYMTPTLEPTLEPLMRTERFSAGSELASPQQMPEQMQ